MSFDWVEGPFLNLAKFAMSDFWTNHSFASGLIESVELIYKTQSELFVHKLDWIVWANSLIRVESDFFYFILLLDFLFNCIIFGVLYRFVLFYHFKLKNFI